MKSIFDAAVAQEILQRIDALTEHHQPLWGTMTAGQMVQHCIICEEYYAGKFYVKRSLLGRIVGKMALRSILKDDTSVLQKNAPTAAAFKVNDGITAFHIVQQQWKQLVEACGVKEPQPFVHWFFGPLTPLQLGQFIYKHTDHHLRQFGV